MDSVGGKERGGNEESTGYEGNHPGFRSPKVKI